MADAAPLYRWNTSHAAEAFDRAAQVIHPYYLAIQERILELLPFEADAPFLLVDLGGGSGRLVERILRQFPHAQAVLVDQSQPFLALAERRLARFGPRAVLVQKRLQDDWAADLPANTQAIVSMSAIHHLDAEEKRALFARCHDALAPGGTFINGDEFRPESDADYLAQLEWWSEQMTLAEQRGQIPAPFHPIFEAWHDRNIRRFGEPKQSGDDCHETIGAQMQYLYDSGFVDTRIIWSRRMWTILIGWKA